MQQAIASRTDISTVEETKHTRQDRTLQLSPPTSLEAKKKKRHTNVRSHHQIVDTRPPGARPNYTDTSAVEKYNMSTEAYESRTDSVLAWKKSQKLGRFDPNAPEIEQSKIEASFREVETRGAQLQNFLQCSID